MLEIQEGSLVVYSADYIKTKCEGTNNHHLYDSRLGIIQEIFSRPGGTKRYIVEWYKGWGAEREKLKMSPTVEFQEDISLVVSVKKAGQ